MKQQQYSLHIKRRGRKKLKISNQFRLSWNIRNACIILEVGRRKIGKKTLFRSSLSNIHFTYLSSDVRGLKVNHFLLLLSTWFPFARTYHVFVQVIRRKANIFVSSTVWVACTTGMKMQFGDGVGIVGRKSHFPFHLIWSMCRKYGKNKLEFGIMCTFSPSEDIDVCTQ